MSEFTVVELELHDIEVTEEVLSELFGGKVENHIDNPQPIRGYRGDDRSKLQTTDKNYAPPCHLIVRKENIGTGANDMGIYRKANGKLVAYISKYDKNNKLNDTWVSETKRRIKMRYAEKIVQKHAKKGRFRVQREVKEDGTVRLKLRRR